MNCAAEERIIALIVFFKVHQVRWELRKRMDEISDLQKALSDAQMYLFDERQHVLQLYSENDQLKCMYTAQGAFEVV